MSTPTTAPTPGKGVAAPAAAPAPGRKRTKKVRTAAQRQRPLWMLAPGGVLMTVVILIPLLLGLYIALIDWTSTRCAGG